MNKTKAFVAILMVMVILVSGTLSVGACNGNGNNSNYVLRCDFHKHLMNPVIGAIYEQMIGVSGTITGEDIINQLPNQADAFILSDGYLADKFFDMGLLGQADNLEMVQYANNYAALQVALNPDRLIGFASVNPTKDYALGEIQRCYEQLRLPGLKLYFPHNNVDLNNADHYQKMGAIFDYCAENEIPILIHHAGFDPNYGYNDAVQIMELASQYPGIRLQIAHMGGSGGSAPIYFDYLDGILDTMELYPDVDVFLDLSGIIIVGEDDVQYQFYGETTDQDCQLLVDYIREIGIDRIVFGSDSPVYTTEQYFDRLLDKLPLTHQEFKRLFKQRSEKTIFNGVYSVNSIMHPTLSGLQLLGITPDDF